MSLVNGPTFGPDADAGARSCPGKTPFATAESAHRSLKRMTRRRKFKARTGERLNVYRCRQCHFWHLGNSLAGRSS